MGDVNKALWRVDFESGVCESMCTTASPWGGGELQLSEVIREHVSLVAGRRFVEVQWAGDAGVVVLREPHRLVTFEVVPVSAIPAVPDSGTQPAVYLLFSSSIAESNLVGVYATPESAKVAKPGDWTWCAEQGCWEGITTDEPGWHNGRGHFVIERHEVQP